MAPDEEKSKIPVKGFYELGVDAAKEGDTGKAIDLFKKAIENDQHKSQAYTNLGLQYIQKDEVDKAVESLDNSISLSPDDYVAYNTLGVIQRREGKFHEAEKMYLRALEIKPDYAYAHHNIAVLYDLYLRDFEKALYHYEKYQDITQTNDELVAKWIVDLERRVEQSKR